MRAFYSFSAIACPANSHYNPCTSACPATCTDPLASNNCSKPCVEGCECNDGFVISGAQCVSMSNCGCLQNDKYYEVCSITYFRGFILHLIIWSLTWTVLTSFYFVFSYRKEKLFGKQTVQANVYVLEMGLCFAIQTHAKQMKFARCRMDSWGVIH